MAFINRLLPTFLILAVFIAGQSLSASQDSAKKAPLKKGRVQALSLIHI